MLRPLATNLHWKENLIIIYFNANQQHHTAIAEQKFYSILDRKQAVALSKFFSYSIETPRGVNNSVFGEFQFILNERNGR